MKKKHSLKTKIYVCTVAILLVAAATTNYNYYTRHKIAIGKPLPGAKEKDYVAVFSYIYENKDWGNGSGPGSDPQNAAQYIALLQQYFNDPRFNTIVDLGCGDWQIMRNISIPPTKEYTGFDVVPNLIAMNSAEFTKPNVHFYHVANLQNFVEQNVSGDLLIVKDVLQHWPHSEIEYFIANVLPNFKYALITNHYETDSPLHNKDILMGPFHSLGLLTAPYNLQNATPLMEYDGPEHKQVLLYVNPNVG